MRCDLTRHTHKALCSLPLDHDFEQIEGLATPKRSLTATSPSRCPCHSFCLTPFAHNLLTILEQSHLFFKTLSKSLLTVATVWPNYPRISRAPGEPLLGFLSRFLLVADRKAFPLRLRDPRIAEWSFTSVSGTEAQLARDEQKGFYLSMRVHQIHSHLEIAHAWSPDSGKGGEGIQKEGRGAISKGMCLRQGPTVQPRGSVGERRK